MKHPALRIKELITRYYLPHKRITDITNDLKLWEDLKLSNLDLIEIIFFLEEDYGIFIEEGEFNPNHTIEDIIQIVEEKIDAKER